LSETTAPTLHGKPRSEELGDFTTTLRVVPISLLAMGIGVLCAFVALVLLRLIGLFTNLFYFGRWNSALVSPAGNHLGIFSVLVPIGGAFIIGLMARYGSERIRGHGIPEAIESILISGSRVAPKVALLKPLSSAISIGSGGPFGAEGPIIMTGGALGGLESMFLPNEGAGWPLISMGAILGGTMRSPFTSIVFAFELTHDANVFLPLLVGSMIAHGFTVLTLKRSILTEKVARRGYHLSREYAVDPLELLYVREVMQTAIVAVEENLLPGEVETSPNWDRWRMQRLVPIVDGGGRLKGVFTAEDIRNAMAENGGQLSPGALSAHLRTNSVNAYPDEPLRVAVHRMAEKAVTRMPVIEREDQKLLGVVSLDDLLKARSHHLEEELRREQVLWLPFFGPPRSDDGESRP
jgi:CBS domain-containing protein